MTEEPIVKPNRSKFMIVHCSCIVHFPPCLNHLQTSHALTHLPQATMNLLLQIAHKTGTSSTTLAVETMREMAHLGIGIVPAEATRIMCLVTVVLQFELQVHA